MSSVESIDFATYATNKVLTDTQQKAEVSLTKKALDQQETVVNTLLSGIGDTRAPEQTGQSLNVKA